jgi:glycerol-3-phosphate dehydrogenase
MPHKTQVLIIGGGIAGTSIARELSRYDCDVLLVEKEADIGGGQTKLSYAIRHPGVRWPPESLTHRLIVQSNRNFDRLIQELDIDFNNCGELVLAFNDQEVKLLQLLKRRGEAIGLPGLEIFDGSKIRDIEPSASAKALAGLYMPSAGVFNPFDLAYAFCESAMANGVRVLMDAKVVAIEPAKNGFVVETEKGEIETAFIVNAAGLFAQKIAQMVDAEDFTIDYSTKATCFVLDRSVGDRVNSIVTGFTNHSDLHRFKAVIPTFGGNLLLYTPIPEPSRGIDDHEVEARCLRMTCDSLSTLIPEFDFENHIISSFSGVTARNDRGAFIIESSRKHHHFIHAALPPPGITCSPGVGIKVVELLKKSGLVLKEKTIFNPYRKRIRATRNASPEQMAQWVVENQRYGHIVCRCEKVTEGEIEEAVLRGATTLDGVKFRTRAGMGTCQGNFCMAPLIELLSHSMQCPVEAVTKKGKGSHILTGNKPLELCE